MLSLCINITLLDNYGLYMAVVGGFKNYKIVSKLNTGPNQHYKIPNEQILVKTVTCNVQKISD